MQKIIFGSKNSLDIDVAYIFDKMPSLQNCKSFCSEKEENRNIVVIENGIVIQSYKGTIDEMNNVIFDTFHLHKQEIVENPITKRVKRDFFLKNIRTIRGLLSQLSRTYYREQIKAALKGSWNTKLNTLEKIDLSTIQDFGKTSMIEAYKFLAFQLGQTMALNSNIEVYTKDTVANIYPNLAPYLDRQKHNVNKLQKMWDLYVSFLKSLKVEEIDNDTVFIINHISTLKYNLKQEQQL